MVLAINTCEAGPLSRKYYKERGQFDRCAIDAIIKARRELFISIVHSIAADAKKKVLVQHQESRGAYAAGGSGGVAEEPEVVDIGPGPSLHVPAPPRSNNYKAEAVLPESGYQPQPSDEPRLSERVSIEQEIEWMQKKSRAEMVIAAEKAAFERGVKDDDAKADNLRKRKTLEDDELLKADYDLQLFEKKHALEIAQDLAATAKSKNAAEKSKADADKKTADRIAAEEKIKLAKALRAEEDEKQKREEEMEAAYASAELDFINSTGDTARLDARNKLEKMMKRKHPDLSQRTRTMRINKLISKPKK